MDRLITFIFLISITVFCFNCQPQKPMEERVLSIDSLSTEIIILNSFPINNTDGHIQGIQVFQDKNKTFYFLSGSSNDHSYFSIIDTDRKAVIAVDTFLKGDFRHAGGFQIMDNLLAVGIEDNIKVDKSKVQLYQIIDPEKPILKLLKTIERSGPEKQFTAGCVAITKLKNDLLIAVGNWDTKNIDFYNLKQKKLLDTSSDFQLAYSYNSKTASRNNWIDTVWHSYQNINFVRNGKEQLYLIGTAQKDSTGIQIADLFELSYPSIDSIVLKKVVHRTFSKPDSTSFKWGGGIYQNSQNEIQLFSTSRDIRKELIIDWYN